MAATPKIQTFKTNEAPLSPSPTKDNLKTALIPILTIVVAIILSGMIVAIAFVTVEISVVSNFTSTYRTIYSTFTTVVATGVTLLVSGQVREMWLLYIQGLLHVPNPDDPNSISPTVPQDKLHTLDTYWRAAMRMSEFRDRFRRWNVEITFLVAALITTSIVASITPTVTSKQIPYRGPIPTNASGTCISLEADPDSVPGVNMIPEDRWLLNRSDGLRINIPWAPASCPHRKSTTMVALANLVNPDVSAYVDDGTAIHRTAAGAPATVYITQQNQVGGLRPLLQQYRSSALEVQQCVPVMVTNPVTCRREGSISVDRLAGILNVTSADGSCFGQQDIGPNATDIVNKYATAKQVCYEAEVGRMSVLVGGQYFSASALALSLNDEDWFDAHPTPSPGDRYVVTCTVDTRSVFRRRQVHLSLRLTNSSVTDFSRTLSGGTFCDHINTLDSDGILLQALSAHATREIIMTATNSGFLDILQSFIFVPVPGNEIAGKMRQPPWAFSQSKNVLEDVLGVISALAASRFNVDEGDRNTIVAEGVVKIEIFRIGVGYWLALFYALPTLVSAVFLGVMMYRCWHLVRFYGKCQISSLQKLLDMGRNSRD